MKKKDKNFNKKEENSEKELCGKCGSILTEEDGKQICPNCDSTIDFFGEEDEE